MDNYFVIHGSYGNPYKNWIPWLKQKLAIRKKECFISHFPIPPNQTYDNWKTVLKAYLDIGLITEQTTFITHSLGGIFLTKFLLQYHVKVKKIIFVAAFDNIIFENENEIYNTFYVREENLKDILNYCKDISCVYSNNDPYISAWEAEKFADAIHVKKIIIQDAGHFTGKNGYRGVPELLKYL